MEALLNDFADVLQDKPGRTSLALHSISGCNNYSNNNNSDCMFYIDCRKYATEDVQKNVQKNVQDTQIGKHVYWSKNDEITPEVFPYSCCGVHRSIYTWVWNVQ